VIVGATKRSEKFFRPLLRRLIFFLGLLPLGEQQQTGGLFIF
jgi:hypothetical protein